MISRLRQNRYRELFAWLALAAVLMRSVIPAGLMPVHAGGNGLGIQFAICHVASPWAAHHTHEGQQIPSEQCPFAFATMAALPLAPIHLSIHQAPAFVSLKAVLTVVTLADIRARPPSRAPPVLS